MNKTNINRRGVLQNALTFTAIIFALTFTISCSSDDSDDDGGTTGGVSSGLEGGLSSGGGNNSSSSGVSESSSSGKKPSSSSNKPVVSSSSGKNTPSSSGGSSSSIKQSSSSAECTAEDNNDTHYCSKGKLEEYGSTPEIGGKSYKTVKIGEQVWMAKNLSVEPDSASDAATDSWCYDWKDDNCEKYGRLYDWATAMVLPASCNNSSCAGQVQSKHRGICPEGFHIPSEADWKELYNFLDARLSSIAGTKLKSSTGWEKSNVHKGTDEYGFAALPGGARDYDLKFKNVGYNGYWWSTGEYSRDRASGYYMSYDSERPLMRDYYKDDGFSVRCIKD